MNDKKQTDPDLIDLALDLDIDTSGDQSKGVQPCGDEHAAREVEEFRSLAEMLRQANESEPKNPSKRIHKAVTQRLNELDGPPTVSTLIASSWRSLPDRRRKQLIVVAGIFLLAGVIRMIPIVQDAREAARHTEVRSQLRQYGLAIHNYGDVVFSRGAKIGRLVDDSRSMEELNGEVNELFSELESERVARRMAKADYEAAISGYSTVKGGFDTYRTDILGADTDQLAGQANEARVKITETEESLPAEIAAARKEANTLATLVDGFKERDKRLGWDIDGEGREVYAHIIENEFVPAIGQNALSTFSIDVDTASYSNIRRFITSGQLPPASAVRIEEMVNYFTYDYPQPQAGEPFSVNMEVAECPWQAKHKLLRIGLKGRDIPRDKRPSSNLVFLIDVSGSMSNQNKLPLLREAIKLLVGELDERDRVSIVTYAGEAGLRLEPTSCDNQVRIRQVIDSLTPGGSTHGSAGIQLAYEKAAESFIEDGTNRVILATDGDLNVGITEDDALVDLIKEKAAGGVFLTVLGFGQGNLQDAKLEKLADNGNGMYAYVDNLREGRKVLVEQVAGSLFTIAKDVKIQVEFNPAEVGAYRLIGYENRVMAAEDFDDDTKDAGEIGAGHTVTALYELVPPGVEHPELKYQKPSKDAAGKAKPTKAGKSGELLTLALRYKQPDGGKSRRIEYPLKDKGTKFNRASKDFQFAAAVASFGMLLRDSKYRGAVTFSAVEEIATSAISRDANGYRAEFLELVRRAYELR